MKKSSIFAFSVLAGALLTNCFQPLSCHAQTASPSLKIALAGDSTVAPNGGWGPGLAKWLRPEAQLVNLARGGRSSKSFRAEGFWKEVLDAKPSYVLIQFGHNDQPGKGLERETDPNTSFAQNLTRYVEEARAIGAKPVLLTSLSRRHFGKDGRIESDLTPYADAAKRVAAQNGVPLVDLHALSVAQLNAIGSVAAASFDRPVADATKPDRTHLSDAGSAATALLVARELRRVVPELARYFLPFSVAGEGAKADFVVASDGSGDFKTVQEAVDAAPNESEKRTVIRIEPGIYKAHTVIPKAKINLSLVGDNAKTTILTNDLTVKSLGEDGKEVGTIGSASVVVNADGFQAKNLAFENNAPHIAQALAIYVQGDRAIFRDCRFLGWQDTIRVRKGRQYFRDCYISGRTDFIYGEATALFDRCEIHVLEAGWISAANTPETQKYGLIFSGCKISGEAGVQTMLGRPWRGWAHTVWLDTEMENVIAPAGWHNWNKPEAEATVRYAEFGSKTPDGEPIDVSQRVAWAKKLSAEEAAAYTVERVLAGDDGWNPLLEIAARPTFVLAGDSTVTDDAGWGAGFAKLLKNEFTVVNLARGGRSSQSFRDEGRWKSALDLRPDYVLIQFGHNDQPGHGTQRETVPETTYAANIARYVEEARAAGITPILVTPMTRREFQPDGKIRSSLSPYAEAVRRVAREKKVALVDLHARSLEFFEKTGMEQSKILAPVKPTGVSDGTHLNAQGSAAIAPLVIDELKRAVPSLAADFKTKP